MAIVVTVLIAALLGMAALVTDVGGLWQAQQEMVIAADAAALAGAQELAQRMGPRGAVSRADVERVKDVARSYALRNGSEDSPMTTYVEVVGGEVTAVAGVNVQYGFARVFDLQGRIVRARAVAIAGAVGAMEGLRPIAFREEEYQAALNDPNTDLLGKHEVGSGNWGVLDFDGLGDYKRDEGTKQFDNPKFLADHLANGWSFAVKIADENVYTNSGQAVTKNRAPEEALLGLVGHEIYVPIVRGNVNGSGWIEVVGFARVEIVDFVPARSGDLKDAKLYIRFIETVEPGPDGFVDPEAVDFGIRTWDLIE